MEMLEGTKREGFQYRRQSNLESRSLDKQKIFIHRRQWSNSHTSYYVRRLQGQKVQLSAM